MFNVKKGKDKTKGQKQIIIENEATLKFYLVLIIILSVIHLIACYLFHINKFLSIFSVILNFGCLWLMYLQAGEKRDGVDLNSNSGLPEIIKDAIILICIIQLLTIISKWFWFLLILIPARGFYIIWVNILQPWFFSQESLPEEENDKKQKKLERKMKRYK